MSKLISVKLSDEETAQFDQAVELLSVTGPKASATAVAKWVLMEWVKGQMRKVHQ